MNISTKRILVAVAIALLAGAPAFAQVDFSRYVALGDSLTAGFASGGLAIDSQGNSYPALIKRQATGSSAFEQPLVSNPGIPAQLELRALVPSVVIGPKPGTAVPLNLTLARPYDNLGVPGSRVNDTLTRVTDNGGIHDLILRGIGTALQQAIALQPTFVTLWIGNNDALAAATSGIVIDGVTLTTKAAFDQAYLTIVANLRQTSARMAFATIPNVTAIPFVTTVPPFIINPQTGQPVLVNGQPITYIGVAPNDFVLLTAQTAIRNGFGIPTALGGNGQPLPDQAVLTAAEANTINARVAQYNDTIRAAASQAGAALWDVNAFFDEVAHDGYHIGGITFTESFLTGGVFSFDGVHPSKFGYAVAANEFIKAINAQYGASIPEVNLYPFFSGGTLPGTTGVTDAMAKRARFSATGWDNIRTSLGIPPINQLLKIKHGKPRGVVVK